MISKETTEEIRSQAVKECRILSGVCRSDGVEGEKLVYGLEIIFNRGRMDTFFGYFSPAGGSGKAGGKTPWKIRLD